MAENSPGETPTDLGRLFDNLVGAQQDRLRHRQAKRREDDGAGKTAITLLFDTRVLARIDADAKRLGIGRTAWLHVSAGEWLEGRP